MQDGIIGGAAHGKNQAFVGRNLQGILDPSITPTTAMSCTRPFRCGIAGGGGWVDYHWANDKEDETYLKIARIAGVHKFGTSYYLGVGFNHKMREYADSPGCESDVAPPPPSSSPPPRA